MRLMVLMALLFFPVGCAVRAEDPPLRVELDLADGSHLLGTLGITSVLLQTPYARLDLPLAQLCVLQQTPHPLGAIESLAIGCYNIPEAGENQQFNGVLDDVMIWKRALSTQEVQEFAGEMNGRVGRLD
ncbi:MAG: hypothetical protein ACOYOU_09165 [Kiritimatiellia bacterium]